MGDFLAASLGQGGQRRHGDRPGQYGDDPPSFLRPAVGFVQPAQSERNKEIYNSPV